VDPELAVVLESQGNKGGKGKEGGQKTEKGEGYWGRATAHDRRAFDHNREEPNVLQGGSDAMLTPYSRLHKSGPVGAPQKGSGSKRLSAGLTKKAQDADKDEAGTKKKARSDNAAPGLNNCAR